MLYVMADHLSLICSMASPAADEEPTINSNFNAFQVNFTALLLVLLAQLLLFAVILTVWSYRAIAALKTMNYQRFFTDPTVFDAWREATSRHFDVVYWPLYITATLLSVFYVAVPALYYATGEPITLGFLYREVRKWPWRYLIATAPVVLSSFGWAARGGWVVSVPLTLLEPLFINLMVTTEGGIARSVGRCIHLTFVTRTGHSFVLTSLFSWLVVAAAG